jgi:hypothetical protein
LYGPKLMAFAESSQNLVRGPAKRPEWAQLIRLGGDRVAVLFDELRKSVGKIDGVIERLQYSAEEGRWVVKYSVGGTEFFIVRILPGSLEAVLHLNYSEAEILLQSRALRGPLQNAIRARIQEKAEGLMNIPLTDRRALHSFANLVRAKSRLGREKQW